MIIVIADVDEVAALLGLSTRQTEILRPQTSGPCVHYDEQTEYAADAYLCTYPYDDGRCPHLDNPEILCPVKDACYAMHEIARMRDECEAEQDAAMAAVAESPEVAAIWDQIKSTCLTPMAADEGRLHTYAVDQVPEFVESAPDEEPVYETTASPRAKRKNSWNKEEDWAVAWGDSPSAAIKAYRATFPESNRTDAAIKTRWRKLSTSGQEKPSTPAPDFAGDTAPITQHEEIVPDETDPEPTPGKGLYGDARALHADMMDGMMCDRPIDAREPIVRGDRVALVDDPGLVGTAVIVNVRSKFASVEFPGDRGPARVYPLSTLRRVNA